MEQNAPEETIAREVYRSTKVHSISQYMNNTKEPYNKTQNKTHTKTHKINLLKDEASVSALI
jgi:hypothetical protein